MPPPLPPAAATSCSSNAPLPLSSKIAPGEEQEEEEEVEEEEEEDEEEEEAEDDTPLIKMPKDPEIGFDVDFASPQARRATSETVVGAETGLTIERPSGERREAGRGDVKESRESETEREARRLRRWEATSVVVEALPLRRRPMQWDGEDGEEEEGKEGRSKSGDLSNSIFAELRFTT